MMRSQLRVSPAQKSIAEQAPLNRPLTHSGPPPGRGNRDNAFRDDTAGEHSGPVAPEVIAVDAAAQFFRKVGDRPVSFNELSVSNPAGP